MPPPKERNLFDATPDTRGAGVIPFAAALLALGGIRGLGQKGLKSLVRTFGEDLGNLFVLSHDQLAKTLTECELAGATKLAKSIATNGRKMVEQAEQDLVSLRERNIHLVPPSLIPDRLGEVDDPPLWLFVEGDREALYYRPAVAVVGTRNPTQAGYQATDIVTHTLAPYPILMVSGLAAGIDGYAHWCSHKKGVRNLGFLGHGINYAYPEETARLRTTIVRSGGCAVSEYMPWQKSQRSYFVERNRLQAGLADIVIPIEASLSSGTAHTVRYARKYGRRLVGVCWKGANGIVEDLEKVGDTVISIRTPAGRAQLDAIFQALAAQFGRMAYPFAQLEQVIVREIRSRNYRLEDADRLHDAIKRELKGPPANGTA
jgi:DNA protecting protein DprA